MTMLSLPTLFSPCEGVEGGHPGLSEKTGFINSSGEARYLCFVRIQAVTATCFTR